MAETNLSTTDLSTLTFDFEQLGRQLEQQLLGQAGEQARGTKATAEAQPKPASLTELRDLERRIDEMKRAGKTESTSQKLGRLVRRKDDLKGRLKVEGVSIQTPEQMVSDIFKAVEPDIERIKVATQEAVGAISGFEFDEELARQSASAEFVPFYTELLGDFLEDIDLRRETVQDDITLNRELGAIATGKLERAFQRAKTKASEGFAGAGLFFSGLKKRALGEAEVEFAEEERERGAITGARERGFLREERGLETAEERERRDITREQKTAIEGGILTRRGEALQQLLVPTLQKFQREVPVEGQSPLTGFAIPEFLRF